MKRSTREIIEACHIKKEADSCVSQPTTIGCHCSLVLTYFSSRHSYLLFAPGISALWLIVCALRARASTARSTIATPDAFPQAVTAGRLRQLVSDYTILTARP